MQIKIPLKKVKFKPLKYYRSHLNLLLLAIFLWLFVVTGREYEMVANIPLYFTNINSEKILLSSPPEQVTVRFKGQGRALIIHNMFYNASYKLNISAVRYYHAFPLDISNVEMPGGLDITPVQIINPDTVRISVDDKYSSELPIIPQVTINTRAGYVLVGDIECEPSTISIEGPFSVLRDLKNLVTEERYFEDVNRNIHQKIEILLPHPHITTDINTVTIKAEVERLTEVQFRNVLIRVTNPPSEMMVELEPPSVAVKVSGAVSIIKKLGIDNIIAEITLPDEWRQDIFTASPIITLPDGIELVKLQPDTVYISLTEQ